jgi:hypothetical protein
MSSYPLLRAIEGPGFRRREAGMRRLSASVLLTAAILGSAGLATACGQSGSGAIASLSPSKAASLIPSRSEGITPSATANASTGVTSPASPAASASPRSSAPQSSAARSSAAQSSAAQSSAPQSSALQSSAAQSPAAQSSAPQPSSTVAPAAGGSGSSLLWLWILIGVIVLGGGIALIAYSARRRSAAAADWRTRVIDVYAEGQALHDAIWTSAGRGQSADRTADPRWSGIQLRADNLTQDLYTLREAAPDEVLHARIVDVLVELQAVRSAMEAPADLEGRLAAFQTALRGLRAWADPSSSSPGFAGSV